MWLIIFLSVILATLVYFKLKNINKYWEKKGVQCLKPVFLFGNLDSVVFRKKAVAYVIEDIYKAYPKDRYVGAYQLLEPALMIRDPSLIKQIMIKDFETFPDRKALSTRGADPLFDKTLIAMEFKNGWHDIRATISPSFTSSKMKTMFPLMQKCSREFVNYFRNQGDDLITAEFKDAFSRYSNDIMATTVLGVECNSLKDRNNEFYKKGREATDFTGLRFFKFTAFAMVPRLMKFFHVTMLGAQVYAFFGNVVKETIKIREEKGIIRPDMIHLMMEAKKGCLKDDDQQNSLDAGFAVTPESEMGKKQKKQKIEITDDDITAQALAFYLGGSETTSTLLCYVVYELALNPHVQKKLLDEIIKTLKMCDGQMTYELLMGMKYLDNVVSETLRKHPPTILSDRVVTKPYTIQPVKPEEKPLQLEGGLLVWIPTYAIHRDPEYFPNPDKFDPERFSDENKHKIKPYTFTPFGAGPRNCIGSRFALLETKLILAELLPRFEIVPVEKTVVPLIHSPKNAVPLPEEGFWLGLKSRQV